jgi:hypothetical protein
MLFEEVDPKTIVHAGGQNGNATQRVSWSSSFEYRQKFLVHPVVKVSNTFNAGRE